MIAMRPFTQSDWYGFAGAEPFADGSDPLIGECKVAEEQPYTAIVIVDAGGLTLEVCDEDGVTDAVVHFADSFGVRALAALRDGITYTELRAMPGARFDTWREAEFTGQGERS